MKRMLKRVLATLLTVVMLLTVAPLSGFTGLELDFDWFDFNIKASAATYSGTCGDNLTWTFNESTGELSITGTGAMYDYDGYDCPWGAYIDDIKSVVIGNSVTTIGDYAFMNCYRLISVIIPNGVTTIGRGAFDMCYSLTSVTIPDSVTTIGNYAFYGCESLTSVTIPDSVTTIGDYAFSEIPLGSEYYLEKGSYAETYLCDVFSNIDHFVYYYSYNANEEKIISVDVTSKLSFEINKETYTMTINCVGNMMSFFGTTAPWDQYRPYIKHVIVNDGCTSIGDSLFYRNTHLLSVEVPDSVTKIDMYAFGECYRLRSITIGTGVTVIEEGAFSGIDRYGNKVDVYYTGDIAGWCSINFVDTYSSPLYLGGDFYIQGKLVEGDLVVPDNVTEIGSYTFYNCDRLTSIVIPDNVTVMGYGAFMDCDGIESVIIGNGVIEIYASTFSNCDRLKNVIIGNGVSCILNNAFSRCKELESVTLGDGVTEIGASAFIDCSNLRSVNLPYGVQSIGNFAFLGCQSLGSLKVYNRNCYFGIGCTGYYTTIVGYEGSTAEAYANENGFDFELIADNDHEHIYSNSCDAECNICGYARNDLVHTYTYVCDAECDLCGNIRTDVEHTYSDGCDSECDICGFIRTDLTHTYTNDCDPDCDICGYVRIKLAHTDENFDGICEVCEKNTSDILVGVEQNFKVNAGETVYIKFVPTNSGFYTFYSSSSSDTYGDVYDANKNILASDDDSGIGNNFSITYDFYAGTVYYLGVKYYSPSDSGEIPVTICLDELICDHNNTYTEYRDSTCSVEGYNMIICNDCGMCIYYESLPLVEHNMKTGIFNPTCEEAGAKICYCKQCSYAYVAEHLAPLGHSELVWVTVKAPSTRNEGTMNRICPACEEVFDTKTIPAITLSGNSTANVDFETNTITGFDSGSTSIDDYLSATNNGYTFTCESDTIGTGTVITLTTGEDLINEYEAVIFGDVNGDSWYDGQDAIIVDCLANGMLTQDDVIEAVWMAADCNHDGVIDQLDVDLLNQAGTLLANVDQSKSAEELFETSSAYVEYLDLIDQTFEIEVEDEEDSTTPDTEENVEETEPSQDNFFSFILDFVEFFKQIFNFILEFINN